MDVNKINNPFNIAFGFDGKSIIERVNEKNEIIDTFLSPQSRHATIHSNRS